jgi:DNA replication protein DnaC
MTTIDFNEFDKYVEPQYEQQLKRVFKEKNFVDSIKGAVDAATQSIKAKSNSFVIYGEPQSGKTEMMICLTAKLLDLGYKYIVVHCFTFGGT